MHSSSTAPTEHSQNSVMAAKLQDSPTPFFTEDLHDSHATYVYMEPADQIPLRGEGEGQDTRENIEKYAQHEHETDVDLEIYVEEEEEEAEAEAEEYEEEDDDEEEEDDDDDADYEVVAKDHPVYKIVPDRRETFVSNAIPSNSETFANLFPSGRRLFIHHDDSTTDGNMNLRIDTLLSRRDRVRQQEVTLFHLRMHDLHTRNFSFRRYCRDSGREVCYVRRVARAAQSHKRSSLRKSWSSAWNGVRPGMGSEGPDDDDAAVDWAANGWNGNFKSDRGQRRRGDKSKDQLRRYHLFPRTLAKSHTTSLFRSNREERPSSSSKLADAGEKQFSNTMLLEFCNYAHVELLRTGIASSKRYEFEYWSTKYQWRREFRREGDICEVSYHLVNLKLSRVVAYIIPEILTPLELLEEEEKGGWIPKCSMWISDSSVYERLPDIAE